MFLKVFYVYNCQRQDYIPLFINYKVIINEISGNVTKENAVDTKISLEANSGFLSYLFANIAHVLGAGIAANTTDTPIPI